MLMGLAVRRREKAARLGAIGLSVLFLFYSPSVLLFERVLYPPLHSESDKP